MSEASQLVVCRPAAGKPGKFKNIAGQKFGRLQVLSLAGANKFGTFIWNCQCDCGVVLLCHGARLRSGKTKSCGCWGDENRRLGAGRTHGHSSRKSGQSTPEYRTWHGMMVRCEYSTAVRDYPDYGGRGIRVCERWKDYLNFLQDMGPRPSRDHSLERLDPNLGYEPSNCKWGTREEQANNTRRSVFLTFRGKRQTLSQWCREVNLGRGTVNTRLKRGWSVERALTEPIEFHSAHFTP